MKLNTTKCDRISEQSQKESNSYSKQTTSNGVPAGPRHSHEDSQPKPNSSFLWNKANNAQPSNPAEEEVDEVYDDVKNCHTYSDIPCYDDVKNVSVECEPIYVSTDNLSAEYDDVKNQAMPPEEVTLVTATPAVILEDQNDSLSILYDDIRRDVGDDVTLYESIAGSLLRLDKLQVGH